MRIKNNRRSRAKLILDFILAFIQYLFCRTSFDPYELGIIIYGPSSITLQVLKFNRDLKERADELKARLNELGQAAKKAGISCDELKKQLDKNFVARRGRYIHGRR